LVERFISQEITAELVNLFTSFQVEKTSLNDTFKYGYWLHIPHNFYQ
jgi:hypothetical protein